MPNIKKKLEICGIFRGREKERKKERGRIRACMTDEWINSSNSVARLLPQ